MFLRSLKQRSTLWSVVFTISGMLLLCVASVALSLDHWKQNSDFWPVFFLSIVLLTFGLLHLFSVKVLFHSNNAELKGPQSPLVAVVEYIHVMPQLFEKSTQKRPSLASTTTLPIGFIPSKNFPYSAKFGDDHHLHVMFISAKTVAHFHTTGQQAPLITVKINKNKNTFFFKKNEVTKPQKGEMRSNRDISFTSMVEFVVHWKRAFLVGVESKSSVTSCSRLLEDSTKSSSHFASSVVAALSESIPFNWSRSG
ncbi:hypothetical protein T11_15587 [Trichinella zimbabwensis]|uniref:Transmembrane protein n=1 Tax=Trichinella zimbabwensis TaxID=268475 RepID=A0A0V1HQL9_9BILA|nr:hypothetical protein T11_15587 [Trichinella zimbabwensis]